MKFVTLIPRVTEPGSVAIFDCADCKKLEFRDVPVDRGDASP
jgi:hypothetical protein